MADSRSLHPDPSARSTHPRAPINWALWIGLLLVAAVLLLVIWGADLAPRNPMEQNPLIRVGARFFNPPLPPFTVPGFPLGTDELGRDVLSRLLAGVRPTVLLVLAAACVRLALGALIGMGAGWSTRWGGRTLDGLIAAAGAVPILVVAMVVIVPLRFRWGVLAFVAALSLTGWSDTARQVREQVRLLRVEPFIEAVRALGGNDRQIISHHVWRHLLPLLAVLFAFEVGNSLLLIATLGFVGYFVGGSFQLPTDEPVAQTFAGEPELGQMLKLDLSTIFFGPWRVAASAGLVALIVLAFNLLGDGLRAHFQREQTRPSRLRHMADAVDGWLRERLHLSLHRVAWAGAVLLLMIALAGPLVRRATTERPAQGEGRPGATVQIGDRQLTLAAASYPPAALAAQPAGALWSSQLGDVHGLRTVDTAAGGPFTLAWTYPLPAAPTSSPIVDREGNLYFAMDDLSLLSLSAAGEERWSAPLPRPPVGSPAFNPEGNIVVADSSGGLTVVSTAGTVVEEYELATEAAPRFGPLIAPDGTIYLALGDQLAAIQGGDFLWGEPSTLPRLPAAPTQPPVISAEGELLFVGAIILARRDGQPVQDPVLDAFAPTVLAVGGDGYNYMAADDRLLRWAWDGERIQPLQVVQWDAELWEGMQMKDMGVNPSGVVWMLSSADQFKGSRMLWLKPADTAPQRQRFENSRSSLRVIRSTNDDQGQALICSDSLGFAFCMIVEAGPNAEGKSLPFSEQFITSDDRATFVPGRIYSFGVAALMEQILLGAFDSSGTGAP